MISLPTARATLTHYLNFSNPLANLTHEQKIVGAVALFIFSLICTTCTICVRRFRQFNLQLQGPKETDQEKQERIEKVKTALKAAGKANQTQAIDTPKETFDTLLQKANDILDQDQQTSAVITTSKKEEIQDTKEVEKEEGTEKTLTSVSTPTPGKILNMGAPLGLDWTAKEIREVSQAIPQWLAHHTNFAPDQKNFLQLTFIENHKEIPQTANLDEHRTIFNQQVEDCVNILSYHAAEGKDMMKMPTMLRVLHIPQEALSEVRSEKAKMTYTWIIQQAWTKIIQDGESNPSYNYTLQNPGVISEDSFKILQQVLDDNSTYPLASTIKDSLKSNKSWKQSPAPKVLFRGPILVVAITEK